MIIKGDITRPQSVKAEFDQNFYASSYGGCVLLEQVLRRLGVYHILKTTLPARSDSCEFKTEDWGYALIASALLGKHGISATEQLRVDEICCRIFGLSKGAPSQSTVYRCLCDLAGLDERTAKETYTERISEQLRLDIGGNERQAPRTRRIVPDEPEWAKKENQEAFWKFTAAIAKRCAKALKRSIITLYGWNVIFGDGTDLEVKGNCFDAARIGRKGEKILRLMVLALGPVLVSHDILPGNVDEGLWLPQLIERGKKTVREITGSRSKILALLDAAFFEKPVIEALKKNDWNFITCANQQRNHLEKLANSQPVNVWKEAGADSARGWRRSQVCVFTHTPMGWEEPVTIVCRRWEDEDELEGIWHYSFLSTNIEPHQMPQQLLKHGYGKAIWMLYSTKQGRENHLKTPLIDLGLHHPPSCRLGVNQAYYTMVLAASNIAMVLRYRVMTKDNRGMQLWRIREFFFRIAGYIRSHARTLTVYLAGGNILLWMQNVWDSAFAEAGRL